MIKPAKALYLFGMAIICLLLFQFCEKSPSTVPLVSNETNHNFFPQSDGDEWTYNLIIEDLVRGTIDTLTETGKYIADSSRTYFYRNGQQWSYHTWAMYDNKLVCCGDRILANFNFLNCSGDSVLIHKSITRQNTAYEIYQHCDLAFLPVDNPYQEVECIKTSQYNLNEDSTALSVINYFGKGIGLIYRQQMKRDNQGNITLIETSGLVSHSIK